MTSLATDHDVAVAEESGPTWDEPGRGGDARMTSWLPSNDVPRGTRHRSVLIRGVRAKRARAEACRP